MTKYEIFPNLEAAEEKLARIDVLLDYPNGAEVYRKHFSHPEPEDTRVTGIVDEKLVEACKEMTDEQRLQYYDHDQLYDLSEIYEQGWFHDEETQT